MIQKPIRINYVIKGYTDDEFTDSFIPEREICENNLESIAEEIAERHFNDDPCSPEKFKEDIGLRFEGKDYWFKVNAEADVNFYAYPQEEVKKEEADESST